MLRAWTKERGGGPDDPLFPTRRGTRLSRDAVEALVEKHAATATSRQPSLRHKRVTPHVLRHSCAMALRRAGVDRAVLALWLGHEQVDTTDIYAARRSLHQGEGARPHQTTSRRSRPLPASRPPARLPVRPLIMPPATTPIPPCTQDTKEITE